MDTSPLPTKFRRRFLSAAALAAAVLCISGSSCLSFLSPASPTPITPKAKSYTPVWIFASFTPPGVAGAPSDRRNQSPINNFDSLCPASSVLLDNWYLNGGSLTIRNNCTATVHYALCVSKGSDAQELKQCATDPFDTAQSQMRFQTLTTGPNGFWYQSTRLVSVNIFYCGSGSTLSGPPWKCVE